MYRDTMRAVPEKAHLVAAPGLLAQVTPQALIADKAFDSDGFIGALESAGITPVIPPKANR